jgi:glycosyltransferase involved in cell wall biosynthesis
MIQNKQKISFIIPAFNEEKYIGHVLDSIHRFAPQDIDYEIILIDNGSTDNTISICQELNGIILIDKESTIAGLRNNGVSQSTGEVLIFIDADVILTKAWGENLLPALETFSENPMIVTGSRYLPTDDKHWLNLHWFKRMTEYDAPYINSGHLITSRILFESIDGFNATLETAEDYDFCMRAKNKGAQMINNKKLQAIHLGYPDNIIDFFIRERWHGRQDFQSWKGFLGSQIAWVATFNLLLCFFSILVSLTFNEASLLLLYPAGMLLTSLSLTFYKYRLMNPYSAINTAGVFYIYIIGRTMSLLDRFFKNSRKK